MQYRQISPDLSTKIQQKITALQNIDRQVQLQEANVFGGTGNSQTQTKNLKTSDNTQLQQLPQQTPARSFYDDSSFPPNKYAHQNRQPQSFKSPTKQYNYDQVSSHLQMINDQLFNKHGSTGSAVNNSDCTFSPAINNYIPSSFQYIENQTGKVEDRLLEIGVQYQNVKQQKRAQQQFQKLFDEQEIIRMQNAGGVGVNFQNREYDESGMKVEDRLQKRKDEYQQKLVEKRQEQKRNQTEGLQIKPKIDSVSQRLVAGMMVHGQKVEDRLLDYGNRVKQTQEQKLKEKEIINKSQAKPKLSTLASQIKREDEDVAQRLYSYKKKYDENHKSKAENLPQHYTFQPKTNVVSKELMKSLSRPQIQQVKQQTKKALVKNTSLADDPNLFRPQLSKKSMKMAQKLGPAADRLLNLKKDATQTINPKILPQAPTFSPSINAVSQEIIKRKAQITSGGDEEEPLTNDDHQSPNQSHCNKNNSHHKTKSSNKWEQLYKLDAKKRESRKQQQIENEMKQVQQLEKHTFKPKIKGDNNMQGRRVSTPGVSVVERAKIWQQNRQRKIKEQQMRKQQSQFDGCTFKPIINENAHQPYDDFFYKSQDGLTIPPQHSHQQQQQQQQQQDPLIKQSVDKFLNRQQNARKAIEDQANREKNRAGSGNLWKHEKTVPKAFHFRSSKSNQKQWQEQEHEQALLEDLSQRRSPSKLNPLLQINSLKKVKLLSIISSSLQPVAPQNQAQMLTQPRHQHYPKSDGLQVDIDNLSKDQFESTTPHGAGAGEFEQVIASLHSKLHDFNI